MSSSNNKAIGQPVGDTGTITTGTEGDARQMADQCKVSYDGGHTHSMDGEGP